MAPKRRRKQSPQPKSKKQATDAAKRAAAAKKAASTKKKKQDLEALELQQRAEAVIALLGKVADSNVVSDRPKAEPIFQGAAEKYGAASRALFNAVECGDVERANRILLANRTLVDGDGSKATPEQEQRMLECEAQGKSIKDEGILQGLKWNIKFICPSSKGSRNINAVAVALLSGSIPMVELLTRYFGWRSVFGDEKARHHTYRGQTFSSETCLDKIVEFDVPKCSFDLLLGKEAFVDHLPRLIIRAMRFGRIDFVRRGLRHLLGFPTDLSVGLGSKTEEKGRETRGVTLLHLMALEASSAKDLDSLELNDKSTNAPALGRFITPTHLAALSGNLDVYQRIESAGGDWTVQTDDNLYALNYAAAAPPAKSPFEEPETEDLEKWEEDFRQTLRPSATLRAMTSDLSEDQEHELQFNIKEAKRSVLRVAVNAGRHHNVTWLVHWFDEKDASSWYPHNGESGILGSAVDRGDAAMISLFLAQPKFKKAFRLNADDILSRVVNGTRIDLLKLVLAEPLADDEEEDEMMEEEDGDADKKAVTVRCTPVHLQEAIKLESLPMVNALLEQGSVDINSTEVSRSALHVACEMDFVECAEFLLSKGAKLRAESHDGVSVIQHACRKAAVASIKMLLSKGITLDLKAEKAKFEEEKAKEEEGKEEEEEAMEMEETAPFEGWFIVLTGVFSVSKVIITNVIESNGGKVQPAVNTKTTHCCYSGRDGINEYGLKMGKGDKKYTASKRKKLPFIDEKDILRYLKRAGQAITTHESLDSDSQKGHDEASFLHDVIKNCADVGTALSIPTLLEYGADTDATDDIGRTPLHYAILHLISTEENGKLLASLDPKGTLMSTYDDAGFTPLLQACILRKWEFVKAFFRKQPDVNIFVKEPKKMTVKEEEKKIKEGEEEEKKIKEDEKEDEEETKVKKEESKKEDTQEGEEEGGSTEAQQPPPPPPPPPKFQNQHVGWGIGHLLLFSGKVELFEEFVKLGGDVNARMGTPDGTPLVVASVCYPDICRQLLQNPKCDVNATNSAKRTLLHAIFKPLTLGRTLTQEERQEYNEMRKQPPATQEVSSPSGEVSILHLTNVWRWNPDLDASLKDNTGASVFHLACASEETTSCIRTFMNKDPSALHTPDKLGNTPLAIALRHNNTHVVLYLIDRGADINGHVYWKKKVEDENGTQNRSSRHHYSSFGIRYRHMQAQDPDDKDGEAVDEERMRMSMYKYAMKMGISADVIYNMLQMPSCDMSAALSASISTGNLEWTERLVRSVDIDTPADAGRFIRLLFTSSPNPAKEKQQKMLDLAKRLSSKAGGVLLDVDNSGQNIFHTAVSDCKLHSLTISGLLALCGPEQSVKGLLTKKNEGGQTPLHMLVKSNRFNATRMVLSYMKEYDGAAKLREILDVKDDSSKTALHYAVAANSVGTYLNGALLSLLVRFGSQITIPDAAGATVAMVVGQMPHSHLQRYKLALAGREEGETGEAELPQEALDQIAVAQKKREEEVAASTQKRSKLREGFAEQWKSLQKQWEQFRKKRLEAKMNIFQEEKKNALAGRLDVPVDQSCPDTHAYEVLINEEGDIYDALLVTTDLNYNVFGSNSFHSLQVVQLSERYKKERVSRAAALATAQQNEAMFAYQMGLAKYRVVERWGRVGSYDTKSRHRGFTQYDAAVEYFEKIFFDKTKNKFKEREDFETARGAYNWVQKVYDESAVEEDVDESMQTSDDSLPKTVQVVLRAITSLTKVRQDLRHDGFGVDGLPLGQLSPNTISQAYKTLRDIEILLEQTEDLAKLRGRAHREHRDEKYKVSRKLTDLSNSFYATIPHDFGNIDDGFTKPPMIDSRQALEKNLKMLSSLEDVENSINLLLSVSPNAGLHQRLNDISKLVGCDMRVVEPESDEFKLVQQYAGASSSAKIAHLVEVTRYEDAIRFAKHEATRGLNDSTGQPQNRLLWHGSKVSNILGILMKGLKIAPPDAPVSGYMFGKGIYFADIFAKSAGYSSSRHGYGYNRSHSNRKKSPTHDIDHYRVMLLCEVAVGEPRKLRNANSDLTEPPEGYGSVQGAGRQVPSPDGMFLTKEGVGVPLGEITTSKTGDCSLGFNEFVVYDESRAQIKYLMLFE